MSTAAFFDPARHPRGRGGVFVEAVRRPGAVSLPAGGTNPDLEFVDALAADIRLISGPSFIPRGLTDEEEDAFMRQRREARIRLEEYGGIDHACVAVGAAVSARAETLAGVTASQVAAGWGERLEAAEQEFARTEANLHARGNAIDLKREFIEASMSLMTTKDGRDPDTKADLRRLADGYLAALSEIRPMGGQVALHGKSEEEAARHFREAAQFYPTEWIEASNAYGPLLAEETTKRAKYQDRVWLEETKMAPRMIEALARPGEPTPDTLGEPHRDWKLTDKTRLTQMISRETGVWSTVECPVYESVILEVKYPWSDFTPTKDGSPRGRGWEQWHHPETGDLHWRRPQTQQVTADLEDVSRILVSGRATETMEGRNGFMPAAVHELAHRFEASVQGIMALETAHGFTRTSIVPVKGRPGEFTQQPLEPIRPRSKEKCRPDHYSNRYMGREYPDSSYREFLSMAMESLFTGTNGGLIGVGRSDSDRDSRDMALGILAAAGGAKTRSEW